MSGQPSALFACQLAEQAHEPPPALAPWPKSPQARRRALRAAVWQLLQARGEAVEALQRNCRCGVPGVETRAAAEILERVIDGLA
jgi:hypothetical protein